MRQLEILLIRHGHVEGIRPARFRGRADLPLLPRGIAEADAVSHRIASHWNPVKVYTSPLVRCVDTGRPIASACGVESEVLADLNDIDYGAWQSKSHEEIKASDAQLFHAWVDCPHLVRFPNGESLQDLAARSTNALRFVLRHHAD